MHRAPALSFPLGRSRFQGAVVILTGLASALVGLLWYVAADSFGWRQGLFALVLLSVFVLALESWRHAPAGTLRWDGQSWSWIGGQATVRGRLRTHLDLQFCLVLSLRPDSGRRIWLWAERRRDEKRWNALRRAVFARAGASLGQTATSDADGAPR